MMTELVGLRGSLDDFRCADYDVGDTERPNARVPQSARLKTDARLSS